MIYFLNTHGVLILLVVVVGYLWFVEKSKEEAIHVIIACALAGGVALILKELFSVPRPYLTEGLAPLAGYSVRTDSLPSLHSTLAFALATTVVLHQRKFGILLFLVASIIGIGRVLANVHYPGDIVLGAVIGTVTSLAIENLQLPGLQKHKRRLN